MFNKPKTSLIGRRLYFKEKRGNKPERYYIGKVIGFRDCLRTTTPVFGIGEKREWADTSLLIETSDHRKVQAWQLETFEVET